MNGRVDFLEVTFFVDPSVFTLKDKNTILYVDRPDRMFVPIKKYPFILFLNDKLYPVFFYAEQENPMGLLFIFNKPFTRSKANELYRKLNEKRV